MATTAQDIKRLRQIELLGQTQNAAPQTSSPIPTNPLGARAPGWPGANPPPMENAGGPMFPATSGALKKIGSVDHTVGDDMMEYVPETESTDRFNKLLGDFPQHEKTSLARKLVATGIGLKSGIKGAKEILDEPYNEKLTDWKEKTGPYQQAANLERFANVNARQNVTSLHNTELGYARLDESARQADQKNEIAQKKNEILQYNREHPQAKWDTSGTTIKLLNTDGTVTDTGFDTTHMSELDKLELGHKNKLAEIAATGEQNRETKATVPGAVDTEKKDTENLNAKLAALYATDPSARKYMKKEGTTYMWGARPADELRGQEYDDYRQKFDPTYQKAPIPPNPAARGGIGRDIDLPRETNVPKGAAPTAPKGAKQVAPKHGTERTTGKRVISLDGGKTWQYEGSK